MLARDGGEVDKGGKVHGAGVIEDGADDFLDMFLLIVGYDGGVVGWLLLLGGGARVAGGMRKE